MLASGNVMSYDVNTGESTSYTKGSPLSDANIADINYNATVRALLVLYSNGNIDILHTDGSVVNVSDYYNKAMTEDKTVTNIVMAGRHAYLTTMFGILKLNSGSIRLLCLSPRRIFSIENPWLCAPSLNTLGLRRTQAARKSNIKYLIMQKSMTICVHMSSNPKRWAKRLAHA